MPSDKFKLKKIVNKIMDFKTLVEAISETHNILQKKAQNVMYETLREEHSYLPLTFEEFEKSPYILDFISPEKRKFLLTTSTKEILIRHLQSFLLELGRGFCFEARQKRITINNEHYFIDLLFYNRILKCHVLIDLKTREFSHTDAGQMNFYLNYFKDNEMLEGDNPPVGIVLCSYKDAAIAKYVTASIDNQLFVSKCMLELPTEEELQAFLKSEQEILEELKRTK